MGARPYCYLTPYQDDFLRALSALREQEFRAGRYDPALQAAHPPTYTFEQQFPPGPTFPSPGAQHASIEEALAEGMESGSGTGSILDILALSGSPEFLHASPSTHQSLVAAFATDQPTRDQVEQLARGATLAFATFWEEIDRGQARYFIVYSNGVPSEIFFAGMSID